MSPKVQIVLLNWNGWRDTIECLGSLLQLDYPNYAIAVCDNASTDGSLLRVTEWARSELPAEAANPELAHLVSTSPREPLSIVELGREQAETGCEQIDAALVLINTGANLGFAGGCNVGLRFALRHTDAEYFWLLNNDTVVDPMALASLVRAMRENPGRGLCGSLNVSYWYPDVVQAEGGKLYNKWTGRVRQSEVANREEAQFHTARIDYVVGASMLASRPFLKQVGLMEESYFLYFEELDWAFRARGKFEIGYEKKSVIYHKEGAAIGSSKDRRGRSLLSDQFLTRNRILFTMRFVPWALPTVLAAVCMASIHRFLTGDAPRARAMLSAMIAGLRAQPASSKKS